MIKLINATTGTSMWVADERKDEYLRAGHKLALEKCDEPIVTEEADEPVVTEEASEPISEPKKARRGRKKAR